MTCADIQRPESPPGVLVVDDEPSILDAVSRMLKNVPCQVIAVADIAQAETALSSHDIQVVLCDQVLPGENGMNFLARLRQSHPKIQRIIMTGYPSQELALQGINKAAVQYFISKPFTKAAILEPVRHALANYKHLTEQAHMVDEHDRLMDDLYGWRKRCARQGHILQAMAGHFAMFALRVSVVIVLVMLALSTIGGLLFFMLYIIKVLFGFDLMPNIHLDDLV